jgi:hypothetical protein
MQSTGSPLRGNPKIRIYNTAEQASRRPTKLVGTLIVAACLLGFIL